MDIRCCLREDLDRIAIQIMSKNGYKYKKNNPLTPFKQLINLSLREVSETPRNVLVSKSLQCPQEYKNSLQTLIFNFKKGFNVNRYLSSELKNAGYNDGFLNDFGLHHFHLGDKILTSGKSKGFVERTGPILIARITNETAYLVGIYQHGLNGVPYLWSDKNIVNIIHNEWPESLEIYKVTMVEKLTNEHTAEQHNNLRANGYNSAITMSDGTIYSMIGGGITVVKTNRTITWEYDRFYDRSKSSLYDLCSYISNNAMEHVMFPINLTLKYFYDNYIYEDESNKILYFVKEVSVSEVSVIVLYKGLIPSYYPSEKCLPLSKVSYAVMLHNHRVKL